MAINSDSDQIHCESDIETSEEEEEEESEEEEERGCTATGRRRDKRFPPPIPFLARTGHLTCHMPWTLHRTYGDDGRLVIREVIDESGGYYFRARRSNGRLTLHLVHLVRSPPPPPFSDEGRAVDDPGLDAAAAKNITK
ncbi:hypothetical protein QJS04_geneDACA020161 [Acorus gramineus]|uniref:FAF domain-containing protein n=1 Tax=Acorus gramineus TaxID=55184 RepID=A0AAV9BQ10_ACOGR|nr:hypothetical protein QJS04_geneDACA020161 [Acorus gramineus]